jgi:hypothetical protein
LSLPRFQSAGVSRRRSAGRSQVLYERKPAWCALRPVAADLPRLSGPYHPGKPSRHFRPLESPATLRCDDRLSSGHHRRLTSDRLFPTATAQGREDVNARQRPAFIPTVRSGQWLREELKGVAVTWLDRGEMPSVKGDHDLGADPLGESDHAGVGST